MLAHDLRFAVDPTGPADAVAREGILSEALGNCNTTVGADTLEESYLGALISDDLQSALVAERSGRPGGSATGQFPCACTAHHPRSQGFQKAATACFIMNSFRRTTLE
ncbi:hypothetical protein E3O06_05135 [Cryobacterium glaciale]|uniref:Uncharacterized protein n=1 Tax=Cryobacterium glaciale TaxID=1259145 RepID=A0A4R8UZD6_9MICO|nr:hypothetical protein [Cryobacterium glaciale]TFB75220.1 hypothetical protein E3O06_05135 [Cryobacterium glaciale]